MGRVNKNYSQKNKIVILFLILFLTFFIFKNIQKSQFLKTKERINIVFYSQRPVFYSFSNEGPQYYLFFDPKIKIQVPGGYGFYRIGALGKLIELEKRPDLYQKTFSLAVSSLVNLYFYPCKAKIYYNSDNFSGINNFYASFFYCSNANLLDRFLVFYNLVKHKSSLIGLKPEVSYKNNFFDDESFFKNNQGIFYKKINRNQNKTIQILYQDSYLSALKISQILEGEGLRINDIDQLRLYYGRNPKTKIRNLISINKCLVIEKDQKPSFISRVLINFFQCQILQEDTEISDIIFILGEVEKDWSIK